jgi:mono/diheme cytochrome c family protein
LVDVRDGYMKRKFAVLAGIGCAVASMALFISTFVTAVHAKAPFQDAPAAAKTVWDGVYSQKQADRGKEAFGQNCSVCHGDDLAGQDMATPLAGSNFTSNWSGLTVGALTERIHNTMPLSNPGSLSQAQATDITAYILSFNKFPAGDTDLTTNTPLQKMIKIEAMKPGDK